MSKNNPYQKAQEAGFSDREREAYLLMRAAHLLQSIREDWENRKGELDDALVRNRQLWVALTAKINDDDHPLPTEVKQNVANLALFIFQRTIAIHAQRDPDPAKLDILVNINRNVAQGLQQEPEPEPEPGG